MSGYLSEIEINALQPPPELTVREWVETHRILPAGSAVPGPKKISNSPNLAAVYDWFGDYRINEITCQKPAQCGFTDMAVDLILWICENDPSPTALFLADRATAIKLMEYRIKPALKGMGKLKKDKKGQKKEATMFECRMSNGFYLMVSWGSSISQTASMSFKYVFCDEINKPGYDVVGEEGNTLGRIRERMETYPDSKFIKFSTPTTENGRVTKELENADVIYDFQIPCPDCGEFQPLTFKNVIWEGGSKATKEQINETARYACAKCGSLWTTVQKNKAVSNGRFIPRIQVENPKHIGLQLHRLSSLFKGGYLENMIDRWIKAQKDGPSEIQNVVNSIFGEPWINKVSEPESERIGQLKKCFADYDSMTVPSEAVALVAGVDVQQEGFWFRIRAFAADMTSWGIYEGYVTEWEELENILFSTYDGKRIWRCLIDTGGTKGEDKSISRTEETYNFIRRVQKMGMKIMGAKGSSYSMPTKIKVGSPIDKTPSGKPIVGGIRIVQINTDAFKDIFWWRVDKSNESLPGGLYFYRNTPDSVLKQYTAEIKVQTKDGGYDWVNEKKKANHLFDCEVLCFACVDPEFYGGIRAASAPVITRKHNNEKGENPYTKGIYR